MNIVITGHHFAVTAAIESIVRAFRKLGHTVVSAGSYNGVAMPWYGCSMVPQKYDFKPDIVLPQSAQIPINFVENKLEFTPDLWLDVNAGQWLEGTPKNGIRATFLTDPHVLAQQYIQIAGNYQYIFNPQKSYWLNIPNQYYVPYAADEDWYFPTPMDKIYDVSLLGNTYANRILLFNQLNQMGYQTRFGLGVAKDDANTVYNQSRIGINWSSMEDITARVFELASTGVIPILNRVPFLNDIFVEDGEFIGFSTMDEAISKIKMILSDYEKYAHIGVAARRRVIAGHYFWTDRAREMLEIMKL
jgi:hypothetical protein